MNVRLLFSDRCTAEAAKPWEGQLCGHSVSIAEDSIVLDGAVVAHRIEPVLLGDVHWEVNHPDLPMNPRYTHITIEVTA